MNLPLYRPSEANRRRLLAAAFGMLLCTLNATQAGLILLEQTGGLTRVSADSFEGVCQVDLEVFWDPDEPDSGQNGWTESHVTARFRLPTPHTFTLDAASVRWGGLGEVYVFESVRLSGEDGQVILSKPGSGLLPSGIYDFYAGIEVTGYVPSRPRGETASYSGAWQFSFGVARFMPESVSTAVLLGAVWLLVFVGRQRNP